MVKRVRITLEVALTAGATVEVVRPVAVGVSVSRRNALALQVAQIVSILVMIDPEEV